MIGLGHAADRQTAHWAVRPARRPALHSPGGYRYARRVCGAEDGAVSGAEAGQIDAVFALLDRSGDGRLSEDEVMTCACPPLIPPRAPAFLARRRWAETLPLQ